MGTLVLAANIFLAVILVGDAVLSVKPPEFIAQCLSGVNFPRDWWWALIGIKLLAAAGLVVAVVQGDRSVAVVVSVGVLAYFVFAIVAHIRARFLGSAFWLNCLGMTVVSLAVVVVNQLAV